MGLHATCLHTACLIKRLDFFFNSNLPLFEVNADGQELEESIGKGINQFW